MQLGGPGHGIYTLKGSRQAIFHKQTLSWQVAATSIRLETLSTTRGIVACIRSGSNFDKTNVVCSNIV